MEIDRPESRFTHHLQQPVGTDASVDEVIERAFTLSVEEQEELLCAMAAHIVPRLQEETRNSFLRNLRNVPVRDVKLSPPDNPGPRAGSLQQVLDNVLSQAMGAQARILNHVASRIVGPRTEKEREDLIERVDAAMAAARRGETPKGEGFEPSHEPSTSLKKERHESRAGATHAKFMKTVEEHTGLNRLDAEVAAVATLCALERRLLAEEAKDLNAQLPATFRAVLQRCQLHKGTKPERIHLDEFLLRVAEDIGCEVDEAEDRVRGVLSAVRAYLSEGEIEDVVGQLPEDMKGLFRRPS